MAAIGELAMASPHGTGDNIYLGVKAALGAGKTFAAADAQVAAAAKMHGISKKEAWAAVRAEARKRNDESLVSLLRGKDVVGSALDLADPLGWRAAAKALEQSERERDS